MGNGAAVGAGNRKLLLNFEYVENLARRGHFHKNVTDYKDAVEECIRSGEMDVLEILIPAGNAQRILPLHIAARLGSLESCELLISAGFDYFAVDTLGRTPLHLCPLNISDEAILCTTLLGQYSSIDNIHSMSMLCHPNHLVCDMTCGYDVLIDYFLV